MAGGTLALPGKWLRRRIPRLGLWEPLPQSLLPLLPALAHPCSSRSIGRLLRIPRTLSEAGASSEAAGIGHPELSDQLQIVLFLVRTDQLPRCQDIADQGSF